MRFSIHQQALPSVSPRRLLSSTHSLIRSGSRFCLDSVESKDRDWLVQSLLLPKHHRIPFVALRSLSLELASIGSSSHPQPARIKFLWWRSSIQELFSPDPGARVPEHPICHVLRPVILQSKLSRSWFQRMISAREDDLGQGDFPALASLESMDSLERHAEDTCSSLLYLALEIAGVKDIQADHVASHIGKAMGIVANIKAAEGYALGKDALLVPRNLSSKYSLSRDGLLQGEQSDDAWKSAIFDLACQAKSHLDHARTLPKPPAEALPILAQAVRIINP